MPSLKLNMSWKDLHLIFPTSIASHIFSPSWEAAIRLTHQFKRKYQGPGVRWLEGLQTYMEIYNKGGGGGWLQPLKVF